MIEKKKMTRTSINKRINYFQFIFLSGVTGVICLLIVQSLFNVNLISVIFTICMLGLLLQAYTNLFEGYFLLPFYLTPYKFRNRIYGAIYGILLLIVIILLCFT